MNKLLLALLAMMPMASFAADTIKVDKLNIEGPYKVHKPFVMDSINVSQTKYNTEDYADYSVASFILSTPSYLKGELKIDGTKSSKISIDSKEQSNNRLSLQPGQYTISIRYVADEKPLDIKVIPSSDVAVTILDAKEQKGRPFTLADNMLMKHYNGLSVSASGKYAFASQWCFNNDGSNNRRTDLISTTTGKAIRQANGTWMPMTDRYLITKNIDGKTLLYSCDPQTGAEECVTKEDISGYGYTMSPDEKYLILTKSVEGPKKEDGVYEILEMDDRQPGWRSRTEIYKMCLKTGVKELLVYGNKSMWVADITRDGKYIFLAESHSRLAKRPTEVQSLYRIDATTFAVDTVFKEQGFISGIDLIPGTQQLLITGSAEAFDRIGSIISADLTPNMYEHQLFLLDAEKATALKGNNIKEAITTLTKDFIPSIESITMNADGYAYFRAENADSVCIYRLSLKTKKIETIKQPCEVVQRISIADYGNTLMFYGNGACQDYRLYALDTKTLKVKAFDELNKERFSEIAFGTCEGWRFKSEKGYDITGHVYLPAGFDKSKKYPMIVHYYGGCSPTSRRFGGGNHYPAHYWNALGYVVLVVNPSGAAGFGEEWGARHVNTAGEGPAQDIIEATKWYCNTNPAIDEKALGCVSASYGGFMSQWITTKTDMFAAAISHAGISDHTSYWGEGYWGYNYSEVSMANSYPWTRRDLYIDCSPLFNADKIHTPMLFTHGTADTNVPPGESIQMYTALKLLGCPTAFVMVEGENHGIMDYNKRQKWINTMLAWFQKYLKKDSSWWDAMYSPKSL